MENLCTCGNWPILYFSGNFRFTNSKKFVKNTKKIISDLKNNFKFSKKTPDLKTLQDPLWRQNLDSVIVYIVPAEGDSFSSSYFLHKFCIFELHYFYVSLQYIYNQNYLSLSLIIKIFSIMFVLSGFTEEKMNQ